MKNTLPLLLASSLVWHAAARADEWTNIATAVTVTEGRLCAGELAADGSGTDILCDTDHPVIDGSGNVGIGTATPTVALDVSGSLRLANGGEVCAGGTAGAVRYSTVSNTIEYCNSSAWTSLGPSDTTPVAFYARRAAGHVNSGNTIVFDTEELDTGSNFDTSTGLFTAPYTGVYQFNWGSIGGDDDDVYRLYLYKNGASTGAAQVRLDSTASGSDYADGSGTAYLSLAVGNTVSIHFVSDSGNTLYGTGRFTYFSGHMVVPSSVGAGGGAAVLNDLTDVNASSPSSGEALVWTGSAWEPGSAGTTINSINDINDVSASDAVAGSILRYDGTSWTSVADLSTALSTTTMVVDWPDAIKCESDSTAGQYRVLHYSRVTSGGDVAYEMTYNGSGQYFVQFTSSGNYDSQNNMTGYNCVTNTWSVTDLYSQGLAFNFLGNNGAQISLTEIADVSASSAVAGNMLRYDGTRWVVASMIEDASGNVGIGTSSPSVTLHVADGTDINISNGGYAVFGALNGLNVGIDNNEIIARNNGAASKLYIQNEPVEGHTILNLQGGNVGVGIDLPVTKLHLADTGDNVITLEADTDNTGENDNPALHLIQDAGLVDGRFGLVGNTGEIYTGSLSNATYIQADPIADAQELQFVTGNSARMTIEPGGDIGIGTTSPSYKLHVNGTAYATGAAGALSDKRHKKNIVSLQDDALDALLKLRPVSYEWKNPVDEGMQGKQFGFIAQEVEKILPDMVLTQDDEEKTKGIKPTEFIPLLVKAVQKMKANEEKMGAEIKSLEAEIILLKEQMKLLLTLNDTPVNAH